MEVAFLPEMKQARAQVVELWAGWKDHLLGHSENCMYLARSGWAAVWLQSRTISVPENAFHVCAIQVKRPTTSQQYHSMLICRLFHALRQLMSGTGMQTLSTDPAHNNQAECVSCHGFWKSWDCTRTA